MARGRIVDPRGLVHPKIIPKSQNPAMPEAHLGDGVSVIADGITPSRLSPFCTRKRVGVVEFRSYMKHNPVFEETIAPSLFASSETQAAESVVVSGAES